MLRPLSDRVIVRTLDVLEKTDSGIFIPTNAQEKPVKGVVVVVGPGRRSDGGVLVPMALKEGDTVIFSKYGGADLNHGGETFLIMREEDILAVVEEE